MVADEGLIFREIVGSHDAIGTVKNVIKRLCGKASSEPQRSGAADVCSLKHTFVIVSQVQLDDVFDMKVQA